jgi:hypothetical protein
MVTTKDELLAANLRKQIAYLEGLLKDLEANPVQDKPIILKTREVEAKLHELRTHL